MVDEFAKRLSEVLEVVASLSAFRSVGIELRFVDVAGGGDLSLGERGQWGELSPDLVGLSGRELSSTPSTLVACIVGLFADRARCTAAADGMVAKEPFKVADLVGLSS